MRNLIAVDAGGTSTRAVVLTRSGDCVGYGVAGSGNPISSGTEHASLQIVTAVRAAIESAGTPKTGDTAILAMAGARTHVSTGWITSALRKIGLDAGIELQSDLLATFCSGAWELDGYAVVAGTGAAAIRVQDARDVAAADGLGWLLGDDGSGFWIGRQVVRAVAAHLDSRGPTTRLTTLLLDALGIPMDSSLERGPDGRPDALRLLLDAVYGLRPIELARFAPLVFAAGDDESARHIAERARASLRTTLAAIATEDVRGPVVCGGGVLGALGLPVDGIAGVTDVRTVTDGTVGAAVLALRANGVSVDADVFERVRQSLAALRG
ncbi:N-acetylglucosamine kinase [Humibacter albus]|uniref:N-acetylglucosamine kinase n=1 Tax=Humibacter albus TaxID=427754 RepID=UPI0003B3E64B|nr:BadF/BadG/BcrA/BcrD ATPase family protein [Humibacter albus]